MKRRDFLLFFLLGGFVSLFVKKAGPKPVPKEAMFWRKIS